MEAKPYNPDYGDDKLCRCGHTYYRHFDSYENMDPVGCKYCSFTSQEGVDNFRADNPELDDIKIEWCAGFEAVDGSDPTDPDYQTYEQFLAKIGEDAQSFFEANPAVAQKLLQAWNYDDFYASLIGTIREAAKA